MNGRGAGAKITGGGLAKAMALKSLRNEAQPPKKAKAKTKAKLVAKKKKPASSARPKPSAASGGGKQSVKAMAGKIAKLQAQVKKLTKQKQGSPVRATSSGLHSCHSASCCSTTCQKAAWKEHKPQCKVK